MFIKKIDLQLFADAGSAPAAAGQTTGETPDASVLSEPGKKPSTAGRKKEEAENVEVRYGKQDHKDVQSDGQASTKEENGNDVPFSELVKSDKYKAEYQQAIENVLNQRLKKYKGIENQLESIKPILEMAGSKYGLDPASDDFINNLSKAMNDDNSFYENYAIEHGCSVEEAKRVINLERQVADLERQKERRERQEEYERGWKRVLEQSESTKQQFPNFDLEHEMQNEKFAKLVALGVDTTAAFIATNHSKIIPATVQVATEKAMQQTANAVQANKSRPVENGLASQNAVVVKDDPSKLTLKDFKKIRENFIKTGERVKF
jgi:hypothetical protein|nr:MAG TPA: hypothetical protein [Caudoviricetes sp.]